MSQASYQKRMREKARADKAEAKRQRREDRSTATDAEGDENDTTPSTAAPERDVLAELAQLHKQFDDEAIDFEEFEQRKAQLIAQLNV